MENVHMNKDLTILKADISKMLTLVLESFELSIKSLEKNDLELALRVIENDDCIDEINRKIEESVYQIIARYNPLAKDLRYAITMIKFSNNLERIGDLSCNIARNQKEYKDVILDNVINNKIKKMYTYTLEVIKDTFKAFGNKDLDLAIQTWKKDDLIDNLEKQIKNDSINSLNNGTCSNIPLVSQVLIGRAIERIADHAQNLCEEVVYIETGKEIKDFI